MEPQAPSDHEPPFWLGPERYRLLIEHIPAISYIAAIDDASSTRYVSPQVEHLLGFTPAEWLADPQRWLQQIHPDDRAFVLAAAERARTTGTFPPCEYRILHRDGRVRWFHEESAVLRDENDQPLCLYGVLFDITDIKALQDECVRLRRRVEVLQRPRLADDERQLLNLLATGRTNTQIAQELAIAARTIRKRLAGIATKLGVTGRFALIHEAQRLGLLAD